MCNRFQTLIVYLAPVPYILYLTRWSARRHGRHGRQHNDQGEQATQSQYTQSISGRHQWRHHLPGHQSQGRASGLREYRIINLSYIVISALFQLLNCLSGNRPGVHGRSGQDQTSRQSFYWARPDTNGGRHERYFYKGYLTLHNLNLYLSYSCLDVMVLNDIIEQAAGRHSRASDRGGK